MKSPFPWKGDFALRRWWDFCDTPRCSTPDPSSQRGILIHNSVKQKFPSIGGVAPNGDGVGVKIKEALFL